MEATNFINRTEIGNNYKYYSPSAKKTAAVADGADVQRTSDGAIDYKYYERETRTLRADAIGEMFVYIRKLFLK